MVNDKLLMIDVVSIKSQFMRSVHLERDFYSSDAANGYVVTRSTISALTMLSRGIHDPSYRAQCITGPYGSGKSALALYFAKLLDKDQRNGLRSKASEYLGETGHLLLPAQGEGYITILVTGTRENLASSLIRNLVRSLQKSGRQAIIDEIKKKYDKVFETTPDTRLVIEVFEELAQLVVKMEQATGVLVIVDELGKLLEHAALHPKDGDVQVLQEMAEAASRSHQNPLWFVTILHQQFSQYASRLGRRHQQEWAKVQQRFFDVPFVLDNLDAFQLISQALSGSKNETIQANNVLKKIADECSKLAPKGTERNFQELSVSSYPLHPSSLLILPTLFRKFGQNERSLFSFLSANEPFSLLDWASRQQYHQENPVFIRLPQIYDYAYHTLIGGVPSPHIAHFWAEIEEAIIRLGDAPQLEIDILKTIGLLNLIGDTSRIPASKEALTLSLKTSEYSLEQIEAAIKSLEEKKIIVFRRFRNAYRLWEGSDIDINERLATAYQSLPLTSLSLTVAREICYTAPIIARRHSYRTGMLRTFGVVPTSIDELTEVVRGQKGFDGLVIQCLIENDEQFEAAKSVLKKIKDSAIIVWIGRENDELTESARDLAALDWVKKNTPELAGDRVARQELNDRRLEAEMAFRLEWGKTFTPGSSEAICFWKGQEKKISTNREFTSLLSDACDETFKYAPIVQNELINRKKLSSAAAAARGNLIKAMISNEEKSNLGIEGYPPERSIYESILLKSGIHRKDNQGIWKFYRPNNTDQGLQIAWDFIENKTCTRELEPIPVNRLFKELSDPPYGVADGFVPVLLCACMLVNANTMALYEDDVYIPEITPPVMERLLRRPESFSVLRYQIDGERAYVLERFAKGFNVENALLPVTRSLYQRMNSLPKYTEMTKNLPPEAITVREIIFRAKSPERLMFLDLPNALDCKPFQPITEESMSEKNIQSFFERLNNAFKALADSYPNLLEKVRLGILEIFSLADDLKWRENIQSCASKLFENTTDSKLRSLMSHAKDKINGNIQYIEALGFSIVGQPPNRWSKMDEDKFFQLIPQLASQIQAAISNQHLNSSLHEGEKGYLLNISTEDGQHVKHVVRLNRDEQEEMNLLVKKIFDLFGSGKNSQLVLAALTESARRIIEKKD